MAERGIILSDVLFVLKFDFVQMDPVPATRKGFFRCAIDARTPNSDIRDIRVVVIPDAGAGLLKVVSVVWVDERQTRAGSMGMDEVGD